MGEFPSTEHQFQPGQSGNPAGKAPGTRSLSTIVKDLLEGEIDWTLVPIKGSAEFAEKYKNKSAWEALVYSAYSKALAGDAPAREWLRKSGYGDKLDLTTKGNPIPLLAGIAPGKLEVDSADAQTNDSARQDQPAS